MDIYQALKSLHKRISTYAVISFYLTSQCSLRCKYCYELNKEKAQDLSYEVIKESFRSLAVLQIPIRALILFGGEPTLREDLCITMLNFARSDPWFNKSRIILFTNGLKLSDEILIAVREHNLEIFFSFDGFEERSIMRFGTQLDKYLEQCCRNMITLKAYAEQVTISFAVGAHNILNIVSDMMRLTQDYGFVKFKVNTIRKKCFSATLNELNSARDNAYAWARAQRNIQLDWDKPDIFGSSYDNIYISEDAVSFQSAGEKGIWENVAW